MNLTYQELLDKLEGLTIEQRAQNVTVFDTITEEFHPVNCLEFTMIDDVLDSDHPVLVFNYVE